MGRGSNNSWMLATDARSRPRTVVVQKWEESERGWGVRPDGYSLHLSEEDCVAYLQAYLGPRATHASVPNEYDRPCGSPYSAEVDEETYEKLLAASGKHGLRVFDNTYPLPSPGSGFPLSSRRSQSST